MSHATLLRKLCYYIENKFLMTKMLHINEQLKESREDMMNEINFVKKFKTLMRLAHLH